MKIKIIYKENHYEILKQRNDGTDRFYNYGKRKSTKAIKDLLNKKDNKLEIIIDDSAKEELKK